MQNSGINLSISKFCLLKKVVHPEMNNETAIKTITAADFACSFFNVIITENILSLLGVFESSPMRSSLAVAKYELRPPLRLGS